MSVHLTQPVPAADSPPEIFHDGEVNTNYSVNLFLSESETGVTGIQLLFICKLDEKSLVAVPHTAWHRNLSRRVLPPTALSKPTLVEVAVAQQSSMTEPLQDYTMKVWIGFLAPEFIDSVRTHIGFFDAECYFDDTEDDPLLPYAPALIEVAQEHFAFFSANEAELPQVVQLEEELIPVLEPDVSGSVPLPERMLALEKGLVNLSKGMEQLLKSKVLPARAKPSPKPKANAAKPKAAVTSRPSAMKKNKGGAGDDADLASLYPALDQGVVAAAVQAGVPKENLEEMQKLLTQNSKAATVRDLNKVRLMDPLSEGEDEGEAGMVKEEECGLGAGADPVTLSIAKLTNIIEVLTDEKRKKDKSKLEEALDSMSASSSDSLGIGSGKKSAAARRALRTTFEEQPGEIHKMIERLMAEDLQSQTLGPGQAPVGLNARSWVEFRSKIGNYKASAFSAWSAAGILDALIAGNVAKARARTCLLLLMLDQASIDKGNWSMCAELSLENPPPFGSLSTHVGPSLQDGEQPFSKLLDPRIAEVVLGYMKDQDDYLTRRKNVGRFSTSIKGDLTETTEVEKRKAKAKAKAKAAASSTSQDA